MKRCSLLAGATLLYCTAVAPGVFAGTLSYSCDFSAGGWNAKEWTMVTSPRFSHFGIWLQETDHIRNATPEGAANDELQGKKASETYTSMIYGKRSLGMWKYPP